VSGGILPWTGLLFMEIALGMRVMMTDNGQQAVNAMMQGIQPDLILMDVQMPVMDGYEATRQIRRWEKETHQTHVPIIALTAGAFDEDRENCLVAGMDDFLTKPVNMDSLKTMIAKWMQSKAVLDQENQWTGSNVVNLRRI